ncbi:MAG: hypothetical protein PHI03_13850, partial [Bacteroidales bacterium]|nr:hypothetical protein [Bacteroidales bacterium]
VYEIASRATQMLNAIRPIAIKGAESVWKLNPVQRGNLIEKTLGGWCNNFPVIDKAGKIVDGFRTSITSIKSIDLFAKSYQDGNKVYNTIMNYSNSLKNFNSKTWGDITVNVNSNTKRILELAITKNASSAQMNQIYHAIKDAAKIGIKIEIKYIK